MNPLPPSSSAEINPEPPPQNRDKLAGLIEISANLAERQRAKADLLEAKRFLRATLDTLPAPLAIINERGTIVEVNAAWNKVAAASQFIGSPCGLGENYLAACDSSSGKFAPEARVLAEGIRAVIAGSSPAFQLEYPGHSPEAPQWFVVRVTRFNSDGPVRAVVTHENVTERKQVEIALTQARQQLEETSRRASLADVATGVLHNVGNVLTSINIAASCLADNLNKSKAANLTRIATLLREHESDLGEFLTRDEKGKQIPDYLTQLGELLVVEQKLAHQELADLEKNLGHIREIVNLQQGYAKKSDQAEPLSVTNLIEDALKLNSTSLMRRDIAIIKHLEVVPPITVEKHKVLQILVNLMRNATEACDDSGRTEKTLNLRVTQAAGKVRIAISDNGVGISPENLERIFTHGFTTKKNGHGFGLHSCARAAKEMNGTLTAHSTGPGMGATFTLELPLPQ